MKLDPSEEIPHPYDYFIKSSLLVPWKSCLRRGSMRLGWFPFISTSQASPGRFIKYSGVIRRHKPHAIKNLLLWAWFIVGVAAILLVGWYFSF